MFTKKNLLLIDVTRKMIARYTRMKKKILLIPLALMGTMLTSCAQEVNPVYIDEWLSRVTKSPEEDPNAASFAVDGPGSEYDFDFVVRDYIREATSGIAPEKGKNVTKKHSLFSYTIRSGGNRLSWCLIEAFEEGVITTDARGSGWGAPKPQSYTYNVGYDKVMELVNKAGERCVEIKTTRAEYNASARSFYQVANFLETVDDPRSLVTPTVKYKDIRSDGDLRSEFSFEDTDYSILKDLKDITFEEIDNYQIMDEPSITYYVSDNWSLEIYNEHEQISYSHACVRYNFQNLYKTHYGKYTNGHIFYSLDSEKGVALADKIRAMMPQNNQ